jgi:alkanesulfonate monooxygenase SsuD/methylene tetrahydromethanopterin reductase-like flavin-dependent oxidoreductase (luciferase family)
MRIVVDELHETGRDPSAFAIGKRVYVAVEDTEQRARDRLTPVLDGMYDAPGLTERVAVCGPPEACAEQLRALTASGARELILNAMYDYEDQLEALAAVAALVRES